MAATAYASLVSLLNTLDLIHTHPRLSTTLDHFQNQSLRTTVDFFVDFMEKYYSDAESREAEDLVVQFADLAHEAEDLIEVHAADRIRAAASTSKSLTVLLRLQRIIEEMNFLKEKVTKLEEETRFMTPQHKYSPAPSSSAAAHPATSKTTTMVGFDAYLMQLVDELIGMQTGRRIIPVVGMGGIGKTTLTRNLYQNSLIVGHFYVRAWVTVSQEFAASDILSQALCCLRGSTSERDTTDHNELGEELHKILYDQRYLIVLDDMWSIDAWDKIKVFFPENKNGSRIVVTTRLSEIVHHFDSPVILKFLDEKNSWNLFCDKTFAQQGCPPELEQVGRKIVNKCKGLPLAIVVIGGLLGKSSRMPKYWEKIAEDISLILESGVGEKLLSILSLSYNHLPAWLKSCFLYLGLFPEDYKIDVSKLIKLWVAEGFIKPNRGQNLEDVAESYIEDLVSRNLFLVDRAGHTMKLHTCSVHDLVRDMCVRIAKKENFYCTQREIDGLRHYTVDAHVPRYSRKTLQSAVSPMLFYTPRWMQIKSRLLRVLFGDIEPLDYLFNLRFGNIDPLSSKTKNKKKPQDLTFRQVNLRFICGASVSNIPSSISLLWSLQTLIVDAKLSAPSEIWKMPQLRHIEVSSISLPSPPRSSEHEVLFALPNLQTLKKVENFSFTEEVCERIPNIKELEIDYIFQNEATSCYNLHNVSLLDKLESLHYSCKGLEYFGDSLRNLRLPSSLKELSLEDCKLAWSDMAMIGSLPRLETLVLGENAVVGAEWISVEEEFLGLKHLDISGCSDLISWIPNSSSFPQLESLVLQSLSELREIPLSIGEKHKLGTIYMYNCSRSANMSAIKILEQQESFGNLDLHLHVSFFLTRQAEELREEMKATELTCQNLRIAGDSILINMHFLCLGIFHILRERFGLWTLSLCDLSIKKIKEEWFAIRLQLIGVELRNFMHGLVNCKI